MPTSFSYERLIRSAWDRTLSAWPLLLAQGAFVLATWTIVIGGLMVTVLPLALRFLDAHPGVKIKDLQPSEIGALMSPEVLVGLAILFVLFLAWIFLIGLFVKGGTYGRLWNQAIQGKFTFKGFMADGARIFPGLLGYQCVMLGVGLLLFVLACGLFLVCFLLLRGGHGLMALLAAIVGGGVALLVLIPLMLMATSYGYLVLAHLTQGQGLWESFRRGWVSLTASQWRGLKLMGSVVAVLVVGMLVISLGLEVLRIVPVVKWFAIAFKVGFNLVFGVFWAVFLPAISIAYIHETED
jgi:hypothetical protein